jgi:hypothetical protein
MYLEVTISDAQGVEPQFVYGVANVAIPYPAEPFAGSARGHCGRPILAMATTWMTAPSVIIPRNANKLRKPKQQLSGTATASNRSRFMAKCACLWLGRAT